jgi:hypothetical protein
VLLVYIYGIKQKRQLDANYRIFVPLTVILFIG